MTVKAFLPLLFFCFGSLLYGQAVEPIQSEAPALLDSASKSVPVLDTLSKSTETFAVDTVSKSVPTSVPVVAPAPVEPSTPSNPTELEPAVKPAETVAPSKSAPSDKSSTLTGGFYLRIGLMNPSSSYITGNAKTGYNFQMGSQYYIGPVLANCLRLGLDVTWFDLSYAKLDVTNGHSGILSALGVGPMISVAPAKKFAITTYVKALPSFDVGVGEEEMFLTVGDTKVDANETQTIGRGGFSVNGVWGLEMRYSLFDIGYEIYFGKSKMKEVGSKSAYEIETHTYKVNNQRFYIGIRF